MEITQEKPDYKPVSIKFERKDEFKAFVSIVDKVDKNHTCSGCHVQLTTTEYTVIREMSDWITNNFGLRK